MDARIILPIRLPLLDDDRLWAATATIVEQLASLVTSIQSQYLDSTLQIKFETVEKINSSDKKAFRRLYQNQGWIKRWTDAGAYLVANLSLPLKPMRELKAILRKNNFHNDTAKTCHEISLRRISYTLQDLFFDIAVAGNIANLGALRFDDGALFADGHAFEIGNVASQCEGARDFSLENIWPPIREEGIQFVYDWYLTLNGTTEGHSNNALSRAACAFSYLFHPDVARRALMDLIWSLAGIEALLGEADQSRRLITDKLLLVFPANDTPDAEIRKLVRELYDFRSRMLHGNRNISSRRVELDDDDMSYKKYVQEEQAATHLAICLLSQLLLYCQTKKLSEIGTRLILDDKR